MTFLETLSRQNQKSFEIEFDFNKNPFDSFFIHGTAGIGKTFLALQQVKACLKKHPVKADSLNNRPNPDPNNLAPELESEFVEFVRAIDFINASRCIFSDNLDEKYQAKRSIKRWKEAIILVIDDLGAEQLTAFQQTIVFELINERYENKDALVTTITSNLSPDELAKSYSDRTTSRITGMCKVIAPSNQTDLRKPQLCLLQTA